jgi:hypothetical protein
MSATLSTAATAGGEAGRKRRHRLWIQAGALAGSAGTLALLVYGLRYYLLSAAARVDSPLNRELRPSGTLGLALGIAGTAMLLLIAIYPLRKRWKWLSRKGKTKNWLDYHILMGLLAPVLITFHSSFKFRGVAGLAYWSMIAVVISGLVGRYLYAMIPRRLGEIEMSFVEAERERATLAELVESSRVLTREELDSLMELPTREEVRRMPLFQALTVIVRLDFRRIYRTWRLRRNTSHHVVNNRELKQALALAAHQARLAKNVLFLAQIRRMFQLWHVIHRPFSILLAVMAILHIAVVMFLGYF